MIVQHNQHANQHADSGTPHQHSSAEDEDKTDGESLLVLPSLATLHPSCHKMI